MYFPPTNGRTEGRLGSACGTVYGSVCRWQCNKGYENKGSTLSECDKAHGANQVYWTGNSTSCEGRDLTRSMVWNNINCYSRSTSKWLANYKTICIKPSNTYVFWLPLHFADWTLVDWGKQKRNYGVAPGCSAFYFRMLIRLRILVYYSNYLSP